MVVETVSTEPFLDRACCIPFIIVCAIFEIRSLPPLQLQSSLQGTTGSNTVARYGSKLCRNLDRMKDFCRNVEKFLLTNYLDKIEVVL